MHVDDSPAKGLEFYQQALTIAEQLLAGDPPNIEYRYAVSRAHMGVGEALHNLKKQPDAIRHLRRAIDLQKGIAGTSPDRVWNLRILSRTYTLLGRSLLAYGDAEGGLHALQEALATADQMLRRVPGSLYHQLDRADVLEAMGGYYRTVAARPQVAREGEAELNLAARSCYEKSLSIWRDWLKRKVAVQYAVRREAAVAAALAALPTTGVSTRGE
jgi:tetratricopeptide (TPR) repeat protein